MKPFQVVILSIFGFFAVVGVIVFATFQGAGSGEAQIPVEIWGTMRKEVIDQTLSRYNVAGGEDMVVMYREYSEDSFDQILVEAIAEGRGPDMILLSQDSIIRHQAKLLQIPYESFPERTFKDTFIELGELYTTQTGILGMPFTVDPLVLYWNRDILSSAGLSLPPTTWEEFITVTTQLTKRDLSNNILLSAVALGEFQNISHAKEILAMLFMQAGDPIITRTAGDAIRVVFGEKFNEPIAPAESALRFYTEFADPVKILYSWNRSLPESKDSFLAGDVALYIGFASEAGELALRNPNLNFDVALMPQISGANIKRTFGDMQTLAILRSSRNTSPAQRAASLMTSPLFLNELVVTSGLPPVRRDMLAQPAPNATMQTFYQSALIADAFLDPNKTQTTDIFRRMVEDITSGRESVTRSISNTRTSLGTLLE